MSSWDIFKRGIGCVALVVTFSVGLLIGFFLFWIEDQMTPLVDRQTAMRSALSYAQDLCRRERHSHTVDCAQRQRVVSTREGKDGWMFQLISPDGRRSVSMIASRKGSTEAENEVDLDDPRTWPTDQPPTLPGGATVRRVAAPFN